MNTQAAFRLLQNSGFHVLGTDGSFIYLEDPLCILRSFETFINYAWVAVSFITGMLVFGWAVSMIRGIKNDIMVNIRNLILMFGTLSVAGTIVNLIYGDDLFARGCRQVRVEMTQIEHLLEMRNATLSPQGETELYDQIEITDSGIGTGTEQTDVLAQETPVIPLETAGYSVPEGGVVGGTALSAVQSGGDVIYTYAGNVRVRRTGGSMAWRNNNPGNIRDSQFTRRMGAIGAAGGFAVFADVQSGMRAMGTLLRGGTYRHLSIADAIARYSPPSENDTNSYQRRVAELSGLDITRRVEDLSDAEFESMLGAMRRVEGWEPGREIRL